MNPRVSRSSALASKATGYPIARVAAQIAVGRRLAEIPNVVTGTTVAAFEPALDYLVVKLPRFPFDKFPRADRTLGSQMKATGEVMAIDRTFGAALNKALRGLEQAGAGPLAEDPAWTPTLDYLAAALGGDPDEEDAVIRWIGEDGEACESTRLAQRSAAPIVLRRFLAPSDNRLWRVLALLRRGVGEAAHRGGDRDQPLVRRRAGALGGAGGADPGRGAGDRGPGRRRGGHAARHGQAGRPGRPRDRGPGRGGGAGRGGRAGGAGARARVRDGGHLRGRVRGGDALLLQHLRGGRLAARGAAGRPPRGARHRLGAGPDRAGDRVRLLRGPRRREPARPRLGGGPRELQPRDGLDRLRRQQPPLLRAARRRERARDRGRRDARRAPAPLPAFVQFGGQTPLNLAAPLAAAGVPLLGASLETIDQAEDRVRFSALVDRLGIPQPEGGMARSIDEAEAIADRIGYPVIVRPSFVIGGLAIDFAYSRDDLVAQLAAATVVDPDRPVRIDRYLEGVEVDVDAVADGETVLIPGLLEHVERAGVHSGDSVGVFPPQSVSEADQALIVASMERIVRALEVRGLVNAQFIVREDGVYLIEVNPRASRTVPFMSKVTGVPLVDLAVRIALGERLADLGWPNGLLPAPSFVAVKAPAFSTAKLRGVDPSLGPFMQSTGEVIGLHADARVATAKALVAAALVPPRPGPGGGARPPHRRRPRQGPPGPARRGPGEGRLPVRRHARDARGARGPGPRGGGRREARRRGGPGRGPDPRPHRVGTRPARRQHADAPLRPGARRGRHPPGGDRRGRPLPHGDGDGRRGGGGDRPRPRGAHRRGAAARRVGARRPGVPPAGARPSPPARASA